jgi:hypothetical protein
MTVDQDRAGVPAGMPYRHVATLLIACGLTAEQLRGFVRAPGYLALADEVEALTAAGLTQRHAERARGYDLRDLSAGVMAARYLAEGLTPARVRTVEARQATPSQARFLARVADDMDRQLAEQARAEAKGR